jgi:hypothetical protein
MRFNAIAALSSLRRSDVTLGKAGLDGGIRSETS